MNDLLELTSRLLDVVEHAAGYAQHRSRNTGSGVESAKWVEFVTEFGYLTDVIRARFSTEWEPIARSAEAKLYTRDWINALMATKDTLVQLLETDSSEHAWTVLDQVGHLGRAYTMVAGPQGPGQGPPGGPRRPTDR